MSNINDAPAWRDKPTVLGLWLNSDGQSYVITDLSVVKYLNAKGLRWFGPIPHDSGESK